MSLITELFGTEIIREPVEKVKERIKSLPPIWAERRSYLLHDWSALTGIKLTKRDFDDVGGIE